jgi:hypothetical protein
LGGPFTPPPIDPFGPTESGPSLAERDGIKEEAPTALQKDAAKEEALGPKTPELPELELPEPPEPSLPSSPPPFPPISPPISPPEIPEEPLKEPDPLKSHEDLLNQEPLKSLLGDGPLEDLPAPAMPKKKPEPEDKA